MKIGVDLRWIRSAQIDGISRYAINLVAHLLQTDHTHEYVLVGDPRLIEHCLPGATAPPWPRTSPAASSRPSGCYDLGKWSVGRWSVGRQPNGRDIARDQWRTCFAKRRRLWIGNAQDAPRNVWRTCRSSRISLRHGRSLIRRHA